MVFTYVPGTGTTLAIKGNDKITIADPAFGRMLFSVWLGPKPTQCGPEKEDPRTVESLHDQSSAGKIKRASRQGLARRFPSHQRCEELTRSFFRRLTSTFPPLMRLGAVPSPATAALPMPTV